LRGQSASRQHSPGRKFDSRGLDLNFLAERDFAEIAGRQHESLPRFADRLSRFKSPIIDVQYQSIQKQHFDCQINVAQMA